MTGASARSQGNRTGERIVVKKFKAAQQNIGTLDAEAAARVITAAADVALVLDDNGVINDFAFGGGEIRIEQSAKWVGRSWHDTVTLESRPKVDALLKDASEEALPKWRQVNHPNGDGADIPILYAAVRLGRKGRVLAVGRDLRSVASLQQQLLEAQRAMEREYSRLRHTETRYRLLFNLSAEALLVLEASSFKVTEANPVAVRLFADGGRRLIGKAFPQALDNESMQSMQERLVRLRDAGTAEDIVVRFAESKLRHVASFSLFRHEAAAYCLVRLAPLAGDSRATLVTPERSRVLDVVERMPEGFVVTDFSGAVLSANAAFLELAQLGAEEQARGKALSTWVGRPGLDLEVLLSGLRTQPSVRSFATAVVGQFGSTRDVEVSAVAVPDGDPPCCGFVVRDAAQRMSGGSAANRELPRSIEHLTEMIGRVPLRDLVRDTTDVIEKMCIEAALQLTKDNRASAAEMLGLSRQSLYVKLRRYGLGDFDDEPEEAGSSR